MGSDCEVEGRRLAWLALIRPHPWEWFLTLTFKGDAIHPEQADKAFRYLVSVMNRQIYGPRWSKKGLGVSWLRAIELQRRGVIHFHALMLGVHDFRRMAVVDFWHKKFGIGRVELIESSALVTNYVCKYVSKDGEIDLGGPVFGQRPKPPESGRLKRRESVGLFGAVMLARVEDGLGAEDYGRLREWCARKCVGASPVDLDLVRMLARTA